MIKVTQYPIKYLTKFHFKLTVKCLEAYFEFYCLLAKPKKKKKKAVWGKYSIFPTQEKQLKSYTENKMATNKHVFLCQQIVLENVEKTLLKI